MLGDFQDIGHQSSIVKKVKMAAVESEEEVWAAKVGEKLRKMFENSPIPLHLRGFGNYLATFS